MRIPPFFSVLALGLVNASIALGQPPVAPPAATETPKTNSLEQLQALRQSAHTPEEKVALTAAWLKAHSPTASTHPADKATFRVRMAKLSALPLPPKPTDERGALAWEVRQGLNDTLAQARSPQEVVALIDAFRQLNADLLKELTPKVPPPEKQQRQRTQVSATQTPVKPDNLQNEISEVLRETRAEARTPAETVALTAEFLRLNAEAIAEARPKPPQKTGSPQ
jgi:hypothetical protein